jgi:hypothetical protein
MNISWKYHFCCRAKDINKYLDEFERVEKLIDNLRGDNSLK